MTDYSREPRKLPEFVKPLCRWCAAEVHDSTEHSAVGCLAAVDRAPRDYICGCELRGVAGGRRKVLAYRQRLGQGAAT